VHDFLQTSLKGLKRSEKMETEVCSLCSSIFISLTPLVLPSDGISNAFLDFLSSRNYESLSSDHPPKRQKLSPIVEECDNIVVRRTKFILKFQREQLNHFEGPIERHRVPILVSVKESAKGIYHTEIYDISDKFRRLILDVTLPAYGDVPLRDVQIATLVATESENWQNPPGKGRLWIETDVRLGCDESSGYIEVLFAIKWNTTPSMDSISQRRVNRPALQAALDAYFPGESREKDDNSWSAQNFYNSVYIPDKDDDEAASIITEQLDTELYPFQKRSVRWLLEREGVRWSSVDGRVLPRVYQRHDLPYSFHETKDADGRVCYISHFFNVVITDVEPYRQLDMLRGGKAPI
jgi:E3 ubiquitin-protein ligase SHPRH